MGIQPGSPGLDSQCLYLLSRFVNPILIIFIDWFYYLFLCACMCPQRSEGGVRSPGLTICCKSLTVFCLELYAPVFHNVICTSIIDFFAGSNSLTLMSNQCKHLPVLPRKNGKVFAFFSSTF